MPISYPYQKREAFNPPWRNTEAPMVVLSLDEEEYEKNEMTRCAMGSRTDITHAVQTRCFSKAPVRSKANIVKVGADATVGVGLGW